jgi:hypothetical protein
MNKSEFLLLIKEKNIALPDINEWTSEKTIEFINNKFVLTNSSFNSTCIGDSIPTIDLEIEPINENDFQHYNYEINLNDSFDIDRQINKKNK